MNKILLMLTSWALGMFCCLGLLGMQHYTGKHFPVIFGVSLTLTIVLLTKTVFEKKG